METLYSLDRYIFLTVNHLPHTLLTDSIARGISGIGEWGLVWILLAVALFFREERKDHWFFIPFIIVGLLGSFLSEYLLKSLFGRPRPLAEIGAIILDSPGNYSFPSTHATLAFAFSFILSKIDPQNKIWFYCLAVAISLSRMYLGVHYFSDVLGGMALGFVVGKIALELEKYSASRK